MSPLPGRVLVSGGRDAHGPEVGCDATRYVRINPLGHRHAVKATAARVAGVIQLRPGCRHVGRVMEELPRPVVPVAVERGLRPFPAVKAHGLAAGMSPRRVLIGVVEPEAEALGQRQRRRVLGVDELAVFLDDLPILEISAQCPDPAPRHRVVLEDLRRDAVPRPQSISAAQPCDSRSDDDHARAVPAAAGWYRSPGRADRGREDAGPGGAEERAPAYRPREQLLRLVRAASGLPGNARYGLRPPDRPGRSGRPPRSQTNPLPCRCTSANANRAGRAGQGRRPPPSGHSGPPWS